MTFESFEDIINYAIEKEKEAASFYEDASRQEPYAGAKGTFEDFAKEERKHWAMLEDVLKGERKVSEYEFKWIPDLKRSDFMIDIKYEKGMPYTDILRFAMKREEKSFKLYNDLAKKIEQEDLVEVFKMLSQEEAKHKLALETLYDDHMAKLGD
jgi:rubrerythrin